MRDAEVRLDGLHRGAKRHEILLGRLRFAAGEVAVRLRIDREDIASQLPQEERRDGAGRAASAIDDDADLRGPNILQDRVDVLLNQIGSRKDGSDAIPCRACEAGSVEGLLDLPLLRLIERHSVRIPQLDPVVRRRIVGRRNHRPTCEVTSTSSESRRGDEPRVNGSRAGREDAGRERLDEHRSRHPRIAPDHGISIQLADHAANAKGELGRHLDVTETSDSRGPEAHHVPA